MLGLPMFNYFDKEGKPISEEEYYILQRDQNYRTVGRDYAGEILISTVWLGLSGGLLFETMSFGGDRHDEIRCVRSFNYEEAIMVHLEEVERVRKMVSKGQ